MEDIYDAHEGIPFSELLKVTLILIVILYLPAFIFTIILSFFYLHVNITVLLSVMVLIASVFLIVVPFTYLIRKRYRVLYRFHPNYLEIDFKRKYPQLKFFIYYSDIDSVEKIDESPTLGLLKFKYGPLQKKMLGATVDYMQYHITLKGYQKFNTNERAKSYEHERRVERSINTRYHHKISISRREIEDNREIKGRLFSFMD